MVGFVGCVAQAVLRAQFLCNARIDLIDRLLLGDFVETAACFFRNLLENFLPIGPSLLRRTLTTAPATSPSGTSAWPASATGPTSARPPATGSAETAALCLMVISKQDGIDHSVGALGGFNGAL